jgi:hypothetical protein
LPHLERRLASSSGRGKRSHVGGGVFSPGDEIKHCGELCESSYKSDCLKFSCNHQKR